MHVGVVLGNGEKSLWKAVPIRNLLQEDRDGGKVRKGRTGRPGQVRLSVRDELKSEAKGEAEACKRKAK